MKRWTALSLVLLMLLGSAGCTGKTEQTSAETENTETESVETTAETEADPLGDFQVKDLKGFSLNILHHDTSWLTWARTILDAEAENGELMNDAVYARNVDIEERYNCTLHFEEIGKVQDVFRSLVASGLSDYDFYMQYDLNILSNIDYLANCTRIPHIRLDKEWWNPDASDVFRVGDKQLAVAGNFTVAPLSGASVFLFNKQLTKDLGIGDSPYALVDEGKWTTDKFYELAAKGVMDLNGDGAITDADRIGMQGQCKAFWNSLILGTGFRYVSFDEKHNPYFNLSGNEKMIGFIQKILDTEKANPNIYPVWPDMTSQKYPYNSSQNVSFAEGRSLFSQSIIFLLSAR